LIQQSQDKVQWRDFVNTLINIYAIQDAVNFLTRYTSSNVPIVRQTSVTIPALAIK